MAFVFHIHTAPSCETTHSTTWASIDGADRDQRCMAIVSGWNRGKYECIHRHHQGLSHEDESVISDLMHVNICARDQGEYAQEPRP